MIFESKLSVRVRAALLHLVCSALVASSIAVLVFNIWYPYPYAQISGGRELFIILVSVDVLAGPLVTSIIFSPTKSRRERSLDMLTVVALQFAALAYGAWTMYQARPVQLVYEFGRFGVAHAVEVDAAMLPQSISYSEAYRWNGPGLKSLRAFQSSEEEALATLVALAGVPLAARADMWQPYLDAVPDILAQSKPLSSLFEKYPMREKEIVDLLSSFGGDARMVRYVPLASRGQYWTVFVDPLSGIPIAFFPLDTF